MRRQVHPRLIGLFVIGGLVIAFLGIFLIGGGTMLLKRRHYFVMYFQGSLNGLNIGSAVKFRGVIIGNVTNIMVEVNESDEEIRVPVIVQLDPGKVALIGGEKLSDNQFLNLLIKRGLRARLKSQSLLSGALYVDLDFNPDTEVKMVDNPTRYLQIPTITSGAEALSNAIESGQEAFQALTDIIKSQRIEKALDSFTDTMNDSRALINEQIIPATKQANQTFGHINKLFDENKIDQALNSFNKTMADTRRFVNDFNRQIAPSTNKFDNAMSNFSDAMYSFNALSDYLSRHPEAILRGKKPQKMRH